MSTYNLTAYDTVRDYDGSGYNMIEFKITWVESRFPINSGNILVQVSDGASTVECFRALISPNGKEINAQFTTDAFAGMSGTVDVSFGYDPESLETIPGINLGTLIDPAPAWMSALALPDADNAWLATL